MRKSMSAVLAGLCAVAMVGCGGSGSTVLGIDSNPRIRVVDAFNTPATANIRIDLETVQNGAAYQFISPYQPFKNGNHEIKFNDGVTDASLISTNELLELNQFYTAVAYRTSSTTWGLMFISDKPTASTSNGQIRVLNASADPVDVYVTAPGADIAAASPTYANETAGDTTPAYTIADLGGSSTGTFQIRITAPGSKSVIGIKNVTLTTSQAVTVLVTAGAGVQDLLALPAQTY